jgi:hypothetical protein
MRRKRGWGKGFEQAFLMEGSIEDAAAGAVEQKVLSAAEAANERTILAHFAPKLTVSREWHQEQIDTFRARLRTERERLLPWFERLTRFTGTEAMVKAPVFLVANSEEVSGGGEANGGESWWRCRRRNRWGRCFTNPCMCC